MTVRLERSGKDLEGMLVWLEKEMSTMSRNTTHFVDQHARAVDNVAENTDKLVKVPQLIT